MGTRPLLLRRLKAVQDAEEIANYIAKDSLDAALRFLQNAEATLKDLVRSPSLGSRFVSNIPEFENLRCRRVKGFPNHLVFYLEQQDAIEVLRILHGARDLATELKNT